MPKYRTYDHRLKKLIAESKDPTLFPELHIPRTTVIGWFKKGVPHVVTSIELDMTETQLILENQALRRELETVKASHNLSLFTFKLFGLQIQYRRLPFAEAKSMLLSAIDGARKSLPLQACLDAIGLSAARFHSWRKREVKCRLQDATTCPKLSPTKLSLSEIQKIRAFATSRRFAHFSITSLSWFTKKTADLFVSPASWWRTIKSFDIIRPTEQLYPPKPKTGIRAAANNDVWHMDLTIIRLINNTRVFIQSIIDNYSRYVLATSVSLDYGGRNSRALLGQALAKAQSFGYLNQPQVLVDSGSENLNQDVDELVAGGLMSRILAQIDIHFSNSMIEAFFRRLKHAYLYLQRLTDLETMTYHTNFYVCEHNEVIPHSALMGATPLEMYSGNWTPEKRELLRTAHRNAMILRLASNRIVNCGLCPS